MGAVSLDWFSASLRPVPRLLLAVVSVAVSTLLLFWLRDEFATPAVALLYLVPVLFSATLGGRLGGITASILAFLSLNYFFIPAYYTFRVERPQDWLELVVLLGVALLVSSLMARAQRRLGEVQARELQAIELYGLSTALARQNEVGSILATLANRLALVLEARQVEIELTSGQKQHAPASAPKESGPPERRVALQASSGQIGEIRLWGLAGALRPEEERLLQTFAGQGALAVERAVYAAGEQRARLLEESDRLKTAILSSVSHDLRTPLATIQAAADSLFHDQTPLEPAAREELQQLLLEEAEHMTQLVGNLLNMSRLESGALKLERQWDALAEIAQAAMRRFQRAAQRPLIEMDISEDLPLVAVDPVLMEQVFINLISNSLKFSPPGAPVRVTALEEANALRVTVHNRGPQIPAEHLENIFEKFYPMPGIQPLRGTGLGLSICKGIVEAHEGRIWAENWPDGVAFNFTLPLAWEGARAAVPGEEQEQP
jgi:two-component system sensor histidine kinase KdpD